MLSTNFILSSPKQTQESMPYTDILKNMGFPPDRAIKALAATGFNGVSQAADWLFNHVNDPCIDKNIDREYFLYAVPSGELAVKLCNFWDLSNDKCGWNGAHNYLPHITLVPPFKVPDNKAEKIAHILTNVMEMQDLNLLNKIKLEPYISPNYMGLFITNDSSKFLKSLCQQFVSAMSFEGVSFEIQDKSFHLTLAYKFNSDDFDILKLLVETQIDVNVPCMWEIKFFSRDPSFGSCQVFEVLHNYSPIEKNGLELQLGDFIYVNEDKIQNINNSTGQWMEGVSWLTGLIGQLPSNYVKRTAITKTWTTLNISDEYLTMKLSGGHSETNTKASGDDEKNQLKYELAYEDCVLQDITENDVSGTREIYIMRHGERIDFAFGKWVPYSFDKNGEYLRKDLNMPKTLPKRTGGYQAFSKDSPLTNIGELQARLVGEAMKENNIKIQHVYVSPSLRCVQTGHSVLCGLGIENQLKIKVEPGLFEWTAWYPDSFPEWMTDFELKAFGFNINSNYIPVITKSSLQKTKETMEEFYNRGFYVTATILNKTKHSGGNVLLVGHSMTLDTCSRQLLGKPPRTSMEITRILPNIHYCSVLCLCQSNSKTWCIKEPKFPPITHTNNMRFDHSILLM